MLFFIPIYWTWFRWLSFYLYSFVSDACFSSHSSPIRRAGLVFILAKTAVKRAIVMIDGLHKMILSLCSMLSLSLQHILLLHSILFLFLILNLLLQFVGDFRLRL
jgi:hypothetical protein